MVQFVKISLGVRPGQRLKEKEMLLETFSSFQMLPSHRVEFL